MNFSAFIDTLQANLGNHLFPLLGAVAILLIGWFIAVGLRALVRQGLHSLGMNSRFTSLTDQKIDLENALAFAVGVLNTLNLSILSSPFSAVTTQLFDFAPRLFAGLILGVVALLVASIGRAGINKALDSTKLDEKLSAHAGMSPMSVGLGHAVFWIIILLFLPSILSALKMEGLLEPLRDMSSKVLDMLPNILAAVVIGGVGWIVAQVLRNISVNLLRAAGADNVGTKAGMSEKVQISNLVGTLVFVVVFLPALIAALDALKVQAISGPAIGMLDVMMQSGDLVGGHVCQPLADRFTGRCRV
jgi:hypothetical protein